MNARWILALILAAGMPWSGRAETDAAVEFDRYQRLLDDHLVVTSTPDQPLETRFDYTGLYDSPGRYEQLTRIRRELLATSPTKMKGPERMAWAINTYNFLVIELVTNHLVDSKISKYRLNEGWTGVMRTTVQQIRIEGKPFFEAPVVDVEGKSYTLNTFERTFVFEGYDPESNPKRPSTLDPRAHFALVCAAQGCPPLQPQAFRPESLDAQLDRATRQALANPAHLRYVTDSGVLYGSSVFNWYAADFGGPEGAFDFARKYAPPSLEKVLESKEPKQFDQFLAWNWKLNILPKAAKAPGDSVPPQIRN